MALLTPPEPQAHTRSVAILCLVAASVLWGAVKLSRTYDTEVEVPVEYQLPAGITFAAAPPREIAVALDGTGWELLGRQLRPRGQTIFIDSTQIKSAGGNGIPVQRVVERAFANSPLRVLRAAPERLAPRTASVASRRLPVELRSDIHYAESFAGQIEPVLTPDTVLVSGPAPLLAQLDAWPTDSLRLSNVRDTLSLTLTLAELEGVHVQPRAIEIRFAGEQVAERTLSVPIQIVGAAPTDSIVALPGRVDLEVAIGMSRFASVRPTDFEVVADVSGMNFDGAPRRVLVEVAAQPSGLHGVRLSPRTITAYKYSLEAPSELQ